jgi:hypothetical protein
MQSTYHAECAHELLGRFDTTRDNELDEMRCDSDDDYHSNDLHDPHKAEHLAQGRSSVGWDRHDDGEDVAVMEERVKTVVKDRM